MGSILCSPYSGKLPFGDFGLEGIWCKSLGLASSTVQGTQTGGTGTTQNPSGRNCALHDTQSLIQEFRVGVALLPFVPKHGGAMWGFSKTRGTILGVPLKRL